MVVQALSILKELVFFVSLVFFSECARRLVTRARPQSRAAHILLISSLVLGWYSVSITLVLLNKWVMMSWRGGGLKFPLFYTMSHMFLKGIFSLIYLTCIRCKPPGKQRWQVFGGISLVGMLTGLDVAAANMSFLFISVSFYTMLKSASLIFILVLGVILRVERCSFGIAGTVVLISLGIFITSYGEASFDARGFWLVISSEVFAALRWLVTQKVLKSSGLGAMKSVFYMSPASTMSLLPVVLLRETEELTVLFEPGAASQYFLLVLLPGFLAFLLLLVEVQLVKVTSSLTLSVFGNLKSIVTIIFSIVVFGESTSLLQWSGLFIALVGMMLYARLKNKSAAVDSLATSRYDTLLEDSDDDWVDAQVLEEKAPEAGEGTTSPAGSCSSRRPRPVALDIEAAPEEDAKAVMSSPVVSAAKELKRQLAAIEVAAAKQTLAELRATEAFMAPKPNVLGVPQAQDVTSAPTSPAFVPGSPAAAAALVAARQKLTSTMNEAAATLDATTPQDDHSPASPTSDQVVKEAEVEVDLEGDLAERGEEEVLPSSSSGGFASWPAEPS